MSKKGTFQSTRSPVVDGELIYFLRGYDELMIMSPQPFVRGYVNEYFLLGSIKYVEIVIT